jgi:hypothetical protein
MVDARQANISQSAAAARHCMYNMCPEMNSYLMQAGGSAQPHHSKKLGGAGGGGERQHWRGSLARSFARQRRNEGRNEGRKEGRKEGGSGDWPLDRDCYYKERTRTHIKI